MSLFLGIDPGLGGALALVSVAGRVEVLVAPKFEKTLDLEKIKFWLWPKRALIQHAVIEQVGARPGQGVSSMFKFGRVYGNMEGLLTALEIPYTLISPQRWMKTMHAGVPLELEAKERSAIAASRLFPKANLVRGPRSGKPHDGVVDAVLIAEYCRRTFSEF